jgi:hypothetical protein
MDDRAPDRHLVELLANVSPSDHTVPSALEWVRRWGPAYAPAERILRVCRCAEGRCAVCN